MLRALLLPRQFFEAKDTKGEGIDRRFRKDKSVTARILADRNLPTWDDALTLRMIVTAYLRSGSRNNEDVGAMSLQRKHVKLSRDGETMTFDFQLKRTTTYEVKDKILLGHIQAKQTPIIGEFDAHEGSGFSRKIMKMIRSNQRYTHSGVCDSSISI